MLVKRQAPADEPTGCVLYRYGTFATQLEIVREWGGPGGSQRSWGGPGGYQRGQTHPTLHPVAEGIESVAIVQVVPVTAASGESGVELTVTCEGR